MRLLLVSAIGALAACAAAPAEPAPTDLRPLVQVTNVRAAQVDSLIVISVEATAPSPGFTHLTLLPVTYIQAPPDGIYDFTAVGKAPTGIVPLHTQPVVFRYRWRGVGPQVRGVRVHARDSVIEVKLGAR